jgi:hypothetical protein
MVVWHSGRAWLEAFEEREGKVKRYWEGRA